MEKTSRVAIGQLPLPEHLVAIDSQWLVSTYKHRSKSHVILTLVSKKTPNNACHSQNTNVYHMVVQCSQMFANITHSITVFNEHLFDVCEDSSKCEKRLCLAGKRVTRDEILIYNL